MANNDPQYYLNDVVKAHKRWKQVYERTSQERNLALNARTISAQIAYNNGCSYADIANALDVTPAMVLKILNRPLITQKAD